MGLSLGLLGRGDAKRAWRYGILHVLMAGVGGAIIGGLLGGIGDLLGLAQWRWWIIGATALLALIYALTHSSYQLISQRQVPRRWSPKVHLSAVYTIWGLMMGCGLYTPVYHTALFVMLATQLTFGFVPGIISGLLFGIVRQATSLWPVARRYDTEQTMNLLEQLRPGARLFNILLVAAILILVIYEVAFA